MGCEYCENCGGCRRKRWRKNINYPRLITIWLQFAEQSITVMQLLGLWPFTEEAVIQLLKKLKISYKELDNVDDRYHTDLTISLIASSRDEAENAVDVLFDYIRNKIGDAQGKIEIAAREFTSWEYEELAWDYVRNI